MCEKILILCNSKYGEIEFNSDIPVDCVYAYRNNSIFVRIIRNNRLIIKYALSEKMKEIEKYTYIIIFDVMYKPGLVRTIRKINQGAKIILYFRNTIQSLKKNNWKFSYKEMKECNVEIWSYSKRDCEVYGFRYNVQFANSHLLTRSGNEDWKYDLLFVGADKCRSKILESVYEEYERKNLRCFFYVKDGSKKKYNQNRDNKYLPYNIYIKEYASKSMALLDIVTDENYGLTLRPLEALFLGKKLITNYYDIKYEKFYNESNIFILNNNFEELWNFLNTPIKNISEEIKEIYSCEHWLENFLL